MGLAADIAPDYLIFDETETVTHTPYTVAGAGTPDAAVTALRRVLTHKDIQLLSNSIGLEQEALPWEVFKDTVTGTPVNGDTITDSDSVIWRVQNVQRRTFSSNYRCLCTRDFGQ